MSTQENGNLDDYADDVPPLVPMPLILLDRFFFTIGDLNFNGDRIEYLALNVLNIKVSNSQLP